MSFLLAHKFDAIALDHLVVCEGFSDARFIVELLKHAQIMNCNVGCPSDQGGHGSGIGAIPSYLRAVRAVVQKGKADLKGVLVIPDADKHPGNAFADACNALLQAQFPAPSKPFSIEGVPQRTAVFVMPGDGSQGTLENLLWQAITAQNPAVEQCVETFLTCTGNHQIHASENYKAKMRVSSTVGAFCYENPWSSAALVCKTANNPIPINSSHFDALKQFLLDFSA
jgi:hypothetical protein